MEKEEITTNDYLKGIVLNLPDSPGIYQYLKLRRNHYLRWKGKKPETQSLFLLQQRAPQRQDTPAGQQNCRHPLYRGKNRRRRPFAREQPDKEIQTTLQCIAER